MQTAEQLKVERNFEPETRDFRILVNKYPLSIICCLALYFNSEGTPEKGISLLNAALDRWPEEPELYDLLVLLSVRAKKESEAEKNLRDIEILLPDSFFVYSSLGKLYFLQKDFVRAIQPLEKSAKLMGPDGVTCFFLALSRLEVLCAQKADNLPDLPELLQIEQDIQRAKELSPEIVTDDFLEGKELLAKKSFTQALKYLQKSLQSYLDKQVEFTRFHQLFFSFYVEPEKFDLEDLKRYIQELEKKIALSLPSDNEFNHLGCSYLLFFVNLIRSSEEQLEKALILDPEFEGAKKALGFLEKMTNDMLPLIDSLRF